jgi:hypothetical protein
MKLKQYLDETKTTQAAFGALIGVRSRETVSRYIAGERMPRPKVMERIVAITGGKVMPNDFFPDEAAEAARLFTSPFPRAA